MMPGRLYKFPIFHNGCKLSGTFVKLRFITVFTGVRQWMLNTVISMQPTLSYSTTFRTTFHLAGVFAPAV
jgi:hypothetical protein